MTQELLNQLFEENQACQWANLSYADLAPKVSAEQSEKIMELCPNPTGLFIAAFNYYPGRFKGNLSMYARGLDYHTVVLDRLTKVCDALKTQYPDHIFYPSVDNCPIPEQSAALLSGMGVLGLNAVVLTEDYGSYVFFGSILTDMDYPWVPKVEKVPFCHKCQACISRCPGKALQGDGTMNSSTCLSHLTQKKGELTDHETQLIANHYQCWGCDKCQTVCPFNQHVPVTDIDEFKEPFIQSLALSDVAGLTNNELKEKYPNRAFTWRGSKVLERNLTLQEEVSKSNSN